MDGLTQTRVYAQMRAQNKPTSDENTLLAGKLRAG